jgi:hypothetical protein
MKHLFSKENKIWIVFLINLVLSLLIILLIAPSIWFISAISFYFFIISLISSLYLEKKLESAPKRFISQYMLVSMIRLLLHIILLVFLFLFFIDRFLIAGIFFLNYITSTIFEVSQWLTSKNKS